MCGTGVTWKTFPLCPVGSVTRGWTTPGRYLLCPSRIPPSSPPLLIVLESTLALFHASTSSAHGFMATLGLEYGVTVALPPGSGDVDPMLCDTSQNLTMWSSPDVISWTGSSVGDSCETIPPPLACLLGLLGDAGDLALPRGGVTNGMDPPGELYMVLDE